MNPNLKSTFIKPWFALVFAFSLEMAASFYVYRLLMQHFGEVELSRYCIFRRLMAWFMSFILLGTPLALPYFSGRTFKNEEIDLRISGYLRYALLIVLGATFTLGALTYFFQERFSRYFFQDQGSTDLLYALILSSIGIALIQIILGAERAGIKYGPGALIVILSRALLPLAVFFFARKSLSQALTVLGILWLVLGVILLLGMIKRPYTKNLAFYPFFRYGLSRTVGDLSWFGLFALPPLLLSKEKMIQGGITGLSLSLLSAYGTLIEPLAYSVLPITSHLDFTGEKKKILSLTHRLFFLVLVVSAVSFLLGKWLLFPVLQWIGFQDESYRKTAEITLWVLFPYGFYVAFRSVVEAISPRPINSLNLLFSFVFYILWVNIVSGKIMEGFLLTLVVLATLTAADFLFFLSSQTVERNEKKVLFLEPWGIGDILQTVPVMLGLREAVNDWAIEMFVTHPQMPELLKWVGIDGVKILSRPLRWHLLLLLWKIRKKPPAVVVFNERSSYLLRVLTSGLLKETLVVGAHRTPFSKESMSNGHRVEELIQGLKRVFPEIQPKRSTPDIPRQELEWAKAFLADHGLSSKDFLCLHLGSGRNQKYKRVPISVAEKILKAKCRPEEKVILLVGPDDEVPVELFPGAIILKDSTLPQVAAILSMAKETIAGDTGMGHLSAYVGTPVTTISGPTNIVRTMPWGEGNSVLARKEKLQCQPCHGTWRAGFCFDRKCFELP